MLTSLALVGTVVSGGLLWQLKRQWAAYHQGRVGRAALVNGVLVALGGTGLTALMWLAKFLMG